MKYDTLLLILIIINIIQLVAIVILLKSKDNYEKHLVENNEFLNQNLKKYIQRFILFEESITPILNDLEGISNEIKNNQ